MYETLRVEREGHLTWCTLDRPAALNAMSRPLVRELRAFFAGLSDDHETRVVILRGGGRAFCAGLDLKEAAGDASPGERSVPAGLRAQRHAARPAADEGVPAAGARCREPRGGGRDGGP